MKVGDIIFFADRKYILHTLDEYELLLMDFYSGNVTRCLFTLDSGTPFESKPNNIEWLELKREEFKYKKRKGA